MMPDIKNVISRIETICEICKENKWMTEFTSDVIYPILSDALALLKREAEPELEGGGHTWWFVCSECHGAIDEKDQYCKHCGARMKKEGRTNA